MIRRNVEYFLSKDVASRTPLTWVNAVETSPSVDKNDAAFIKKETCGIW